MTRVEEADRRRASLLPACAEDYVGPDALVRIVDAFVDSFDISDLRFARSVPGSRRF